MYNHYITVPIANNYTYLFFFNCHYRLCNYCLHNFDFCAMILIRVCDN